MKKQWWKEAVAYQIYPRSFYDSNGDGIGDLQGIIQKLDYLKDLGIEVIWINPIYQSPNDDNGYDISDFYDIMDDFGTMADFDELLKEVHDRGMKIILDLVINHTSDEHEWFIESRSSKDNPYRDFYIWQPGKPDGSPVNNWESFFGGSVWEYDEKTGEYYMHIFSKKQPDLNWENPRVRKRLYEMTNWWLEKGIDGFRVDAITHIKKKKGYPDLPNPKNRTFVPSNPGHANQPGIDAFLSEFVERTIKNYDVMTVGEAGGAKFEEVRHWIGEEGGYFNMIFQFDHLGLWKAKDGELNMDELKKTMTKWQKGLEGQGWNALFIENHDQPRSVSTWGDDTAFRKTSAKAFATFYFFMQGTPFIYQGQEIGMTNVRFDSIEAYNDTGLINLYEHETKNGMSHEEMMSYIWKNGRDNARTPMQWSNASQAGFTTGTPWFGVNPNYPNINVEEAVKDPDSILNYYKKMIKLRKHTPALIYGSYELIAEAHPHVFAYLRLYKNARYAVIVNLFNEQTEISLADDLEIEELLLSNKAVEDETNPAMQMAPYEARVYKLADR